jgi:hypothetical protein
MLAIQIVSKGSLTEAGQAARPPGLSTFMHIPIEGFDSGSE